MTSLIFSVPSRVGALNDALRIVKVQMRDQSISLLRVCVEPPPASYLVM